MNLANEGLEAKKKEEEVEAKKRKAEDDKQWEGLYLTHNLSPFLFCLTSLAMIENREQRVGSWRTFNNGKKKQKKSKTNVLG